MSQKKDSCMTNSESPAIVSYVQKNGLQSLVDEFAIKVKRHQEYDHLVLLKYDQLNTPMNDLTRECRGIILDENNNWDVVCYTYRRFANYGESWADKVDFSTAKVYEKLDGSLCQLYYYDNTWHVATSGTPDASGEVLGTVTTFADLFWKTWERMGYKFPKKRHHCFAFELMTPHNRVVVRHNEPKLILHGGRDLRTYRELNPVVEAHVNGWKCVETFPLQSWDEILDAANQLDPMEGEGYIVCDANYNRVKVKSPQYVAVAHMRDGFSTRRMLEIVRTNEHNEFLSYYNEYEKLYWEIKAKYEHLVGNIEGFYEAIKHIDDRKQFALSATTQKYSGILFGLKFGKTNSVRESLADVNIKQLEQLLGLKSIEI